MKRFLALVLIFTIVALPLSETAAAPRPSVPKNAISLTPTVGGLVFSGAEKLEPAPVYGLKLAYDMMLNSIADSISVEGTANYFTTKSKTTGDKVPGYLLRVEAAYPFAFSSKLVPFLAIGGGAFRKDGETERKTYPVFNYGGGLKYFLEDYLALRGDFRHLLTYTDVNTRNNFELAFGLTYLFGKKKPAPKVEPKAPLCRDVPPGVTVDVNGCPFDSDRDGVPDYLDKCPDTPFGLPVDKDGCPIVEKIGQARYTKVVTLRGGNVEVTTPRGDISAKVPEGKMVIVREGSGISGPMAAGPDDLAAAKDAESVTSGAPPDRTKVLTLEGRADVAAADGKGKIPLSAGNVVTVKKGEAPGKPAPATEAEMKRAREAAMIEVAPEVPTTPTGTGAAAAPAALAGAKAAEAPAAGKAAGEATVKPGTVAKEGVGTAAKGATPSASVPATTGAPAAAAGAAAAVTARGAAGAADREAKPAPKADAVTGAAPEKAAKAPAAEAGKEGAKDTRIIGLEGSVKVTNPEGKGAVIVRPGTAVTVRKGEKPTRPAPASAEEMRKARAAALVTGLPPAAEGKTALRERKIVIEFGSGKSDIPKEYDERLKIVATEVKNNPGATARIEGHADAAGNEDLNLRLSRDRADAVKGFLVGAGVDPYIISTAGYGSSRPIADNSTAAGRQQNRRAVTTVTIMIPVPASAPPAGAGPASAAGAPAEAVAPAKGAAAATGAGAKVSAGKGAPGAKAGAVPTTGTGAAAAPAAPAGAKAAEVPPQSAAAGTAAGEATVKPGTVAKEGVGTAAKGATLSASVPATTGAPAAAAGAAAAVTARGAAGAADKEATAVPKADAVTGAAPEKAAKAPAAEAGKEGTKDTRIIGLEGSVKVTNPEGKGAVIVRPGTAVTVRKGERPTRPAPASAEELKKARAAASVTGLSPAAEAKTALRERKIVIEFGSGKAEIPKEYDERLKIVATEVKSNPGATARIEGHADATGNEDLNLRLSRDRAEAVKGFLVGAGVDPYIISTAGYGSSQPVADNATAAGRQQNRRAVTTVTITIPVPAAAPSTGAVPASGAGAPAEAVAPAKGAAAPGAGAKVTAGKAAPGATAGAAPASATGTSVGTAPAAGTASKEASGAATGAAAPQGKGVAAAPAAAPQSGTEAVSSAAAAVGGPAPATGAAGGTAPATATAPAAGAAPSAGAAPAVAAGAKPAAQTGAPGPAPAAAPVAPATGSTSAIGTAPGTGATSAAVSGIPAPATGPSAAGVPAAGAVPVTGAARGAGTPAGGAAPKGAGAPATSAPAGAVPAPAGATGSGKAAAPGQVTAAPAKGAAPAGGAMTPVPGAAAPAAGTAAAPGGGESGGRFGTAITALEGKVAVRGTVPGRPVTLTPGTKTFVPAGEPPTAPVPASPAELQAARDAWLVESLLPEVPAAVPVGKRVAKKLTIEFDNNSWTIRAKYLRSLKKLAAFIQSAQGSTVRIDGRADIIGKKAYNLKLSRKRAESVKSILVTYGADPQSITTRGFGVANPLGDNATPEGRQRNRSAVTKVTILIFEDAANGKAAAPAATAGKTKTKKTRAGRR